MYPESIDKFTEKLNKIEGNTYVLEEEIIISDGVYEGELEHDNVSLPSISVYTGKKLTGEKINNFILSTPSSTPWKKNIKIFASDPKVYISYETQGDTVEADDINKVQESTVSTQVEVNKYKASNNLEVGSLKVRTTNLENNKSEKTYVDVEFNKRYLKEQVFTKEEILQKIQDVIGVAPQALDTLQEIAKSLDNDADFAGTITKQLTTKVDKVPGKQLSTEDYATEEKQKLAGIETNANKYIHPSTHSADMIVENINRRFVSDVEKQTFNSKETPQGAQTKADNALKISKEYVDTEKANKTHYHNTLDISHDNEVNIANGYDLDTGNLDLNYRGTKKPIKLVRVMNGQTNYGLATLQATTFMNANSEEVAYKKDISTHNHDGRYYTETEINNIVGLEGLETLNKTLKGAINEVKATVTIGGSVANADTVDGKHASDFAVALHNHTGNQIDSPRGDLNKDNGTTREIRWINYGSGHTIFDASSGKSPTGVAKNNTNPDVAWSPTFPTLMGYNGSNTYGVRVDIARISESCSGNADTLDGKHASELMPKGSVTWNNLKGV
ncbi:hypothetical protein LGL55_05835 [Clostridium tagluense]|uniref:hypothetical protein n=1 Tax=Clostridium tagluense TaxID=360422 RepID=UPI001CF599BC|nr:hypothetical protein [Clostridium tagluense]MCB2310642.1 hypothetical protein [Clostridium tagluense]MCB2315627.1 hypothetical protein [Clostridium tagluense]MCB2320481.1 hypothetical protein [Clostridium tagluense]MCB2325236.1 hypothetical protein [Clostridium tagluense]MCB2330088.1 hypothetical protein [Clostridium tagluense]